MRPNGTVPLWNSRPRCVDHQGQRRAQERGDLRCGPLEAFKVANRRTAVSYSNKLPSLARPSLLHRLDRKDSKIFVHPLGTRLDVCNGHTRCLSVCHLRWWTNANEPRRISKTLHNSDAAPRLEQHIDVTRSIVGDESFTCRQHMICAQGRVFNRACSRCTQEDRRCDRVPCQQKHRFLPDTHTQHTHTTHTHTHTHTEPAELVFRSSWPRPAARECPSTEILQMNPKPASMFASSRPSCKTDARC